MEELVQRHMDSMSEEFEEMRRTKLFTQEECRLIMRTRKDLEYKINGVSKSLQDFKDYILYEKALLKKIDNRRDKHKIYERKNGVEYKILRRIKNLYEIALQRSSGDFALSLSYFEFCKKSKHINAASAAVQNMIKNCSEEAEVWQVAATWYSHDRNDLDAALKVLNKGLTIHKTSQNLYTEAIKLELSAVKSQGGVEDDETFKKQIAQKIVTYVKFIGDYINDYSYLIEILNLLEPHPFTKNVQNIIIDRLLEKYSDKESVWHTLAQREKRGLHYGMSTEQIKKSGETPLTLCFAKYQEGLDKVSTSEKARLWSMYLDCLIRVQHETNELSNVIKKNLLKSALEKAANEKYLVEEYYINWLELATDEEALDILAKGTSNIPNSIKLWELRLYYTKLTEENAKVDEVFNQGIRELKENSLPLWFMYLRYHVLLSKEDIIESIYRKGIVQPQKISDVLKPKYIEWLAITKGITQARKMYNNLAYQKPYCKELHAVMSRLESAQMVYDFEVWGKVHELACNQFGEDDVDVWINHILFYLHFNKSGNVNEKVQSICREAENKLSPLLHLDFKGKYSKALSDQ